MDLVEGLRLGVGITGGALVGQLLEHADVTTDLDVGITGILESGIQLNDNLWAQGYVLFTFPYMSIPSSFDTFEVSALGQFIASLNYVSERLSVVFGISTAITSDNLLTQNGFFDGSSLQYSYRMLGEVGYFVIEDLFVYGGVELFGNKAALFDNSNAYTGVQYFLL